MDRTQRMEAAAERDRQSRNELEATYRAARGTEPPRPQTEADSAARTALVRASNKRRGAIVDSIGRNQQWESIARYALDDFPKPLGPSSHVHYSGGGNVYHRYSDCPALAAGKSKAHESGKGERAMSVTTLEEAEKTRGFSGKLLRACSECVP